jgi:L-fuculose-phosphate aldolase
MSRFDLARRQVLEACLHLADRGFLPGTGGNLALRVDEFCAVTPSGMDYYAMRAEDVCMVRLRDLRVVEGERRPTIELRLHAELLARRSDCVASVHTHSPLASACALLGRDLEIADPSLAALLGPRAVHVRYAPSGTGWLVRKLGRALRADCHAYLLANHGAVCCGATLDQAVARAAALEEAAAQFLDRALAGREGENPYPHFSLLRALIFQERSMR